MLDTPWNAEYSAAEAAWRIERDQACAEHRKPPKKPLKLPRPRVVDMGDAEGVEGAGDVEGMEGEDDEDGAQDIEAPDDQEAEELAKWSEIAEFCNVHACKQQLPILSYTYMLRSQTRTSKNPMPTTWFSTLSFR